MMMKLAGKTSALAIVAALLAAGADGCGEADEGFAGAEEDIAALSNRDGGPTVDREDRKAELEWRSGHRRSLVPLLQCVESLPNGQLRAHWGYMNNSRNPVRRKLGSRNTFAPRPADRGQPTLFEPGVHKDVFTTTFNGSRTLVWTLEGLKTAAKSNSLRCNVGGAGSGAAGSVSTGGTGGASNGGAGGVVGAAGQSAGAGGVVAAGGSGGGGGQIAGAGAGAGGNGQVAGAGAGGNGQVAGAGGAGGAGGLGGTGGQLAGAGGVGGAGGLGGTGGQVAGAGGVGGAGGAGGQVAGTGGTGGAGTGGGNTLPGDGNAECKACRLDKCKDFQGQGFDVYQGCFLAVNSSLGANASDPTFLQECIDVMKCAYTNKCGFNTNELGQCFCGTASFDTCFSTTTADGPCKSQITAAARSTSLTDISVRFTDLAYPLGWAFFLQKCDTNDCASVCPPQ